MASNPTSGLKRRQLIAAAGAAALAAPRISFGQANAPVKIGMLAARQGPFAQQGEAIAFGAKVALEQANTTVMGRPVQFILYDEPNPLGAQQNMQKLIGDDKVHAVIGGSTSAVALAISAVSAQAKMPTIISSALTREITGKNCSRYVFRDNCTAPAYARVLAPYLLPQGKKWYFVVANYAYGMEVYLTLKDELLKAGGQDLGLEQIPVGTNDYSSTILKIRQARPDVVVLGITGTDMTAFLKQFDEFGLRGRIGLASLTTTDEDLRGQPGITGIYGKGWHYNNPLNTPAEKAFNVAVSKQTGFPASLSNYHGWIAMRMMLGGLEKAGSTDAKAIVRGLETVRPPAVPTYYREWDHQLMLQPLVVQVRDTITDRNDMVRIISKPLPEAEVERLHGTQEEIGCRMPAL